MQIQIDNIDSFEDGMSVTVRGTDTPIGPSGMDYQIDLIRNGQTLTTSGFQTASASSGDIVETIDFSDLGIPDGDDWEIFVIANLLNPTPDSDSTTVTVDGPTPASVSIIDTDASENTASVTTSVVGVQTTYTLDVQIADGSTVLASTEFTQDGNFPTEETTFTDLGIPAGENRELRFDVNLLEPDPDYASTTLIVPGPSDTGSGGDDGTGGDDGGTTDPGTQASVSIVSEPVTDVNLVDVEFTWSAPSSTTASVAFEDGFGNIIDSETLTVGSVNESGRNAIALSNMDIGAGESVSGQVSVTLTEFGVTDSRVATVPGPGGDGGNGGDDGGGDGGDTTFDPSAVSVECTNLPSSAPPGRPFNVGVTATNDNDVAGIGDLIVLADGNEIGRLADASLAAREAAGFQIQAIAPTSPNSEAEITVETEGYSTVTGLAPAASR